MSPLGKVISMFPSRDVLGRELLEAMLERKDDEERPEYRAGTRYEVIVNTERPEKVAETIKNSGGKNVRISNS